MIYTGILFRLDTPNLSSLTTSAYVTPVHIPIESPRNIIRSFFPFENFDLTAAYWYALPR